MTAQAVQVNMTSPRDPSISEDNDQAQSGQKPTSAATPAKMYMCNSGTMPSSNAFHGGRASAIDTCEVFGDDANVKEPADHMLDGNKDPLPRMSSRFLSI